MEPARFSAYIGGAQLKSDAGKLPAAVVKSADVRVPLNVYPLGGDVLSGDNQHTV
jgi:hypothetical protein